VFAPIASRILVQTSCFDSSVRTPISYLRSKFGKHTFVAFSDGGNAIAAFSDEDEALRVWNQWMEEDPDVESHSAILEFDGNGMPVRRILEVKYKDGVV